MIIERQKAREQEPARRIHNFDEVSQGFDEQTMLLEASRCLNCKNPACVNGCPVNIDIPAFIQELKKNNPIGANEIIKKSSSLPAVCGRVCPQETQCEKYCVRKKSGGSVAIGALERYAADFALNADTPVKKSDEFNNVKVAIIGSGPSGLSCAGELANHGVKVTIFEAFHRAGGVLVYGIPEFRLPKEIVDKEIKKLEELGVEIKINKVIGKTFYIEELLKEYDFVFIGSGAGLPVFMNIKGENLNGVFSANEVLTRVNLMKAYEQGSETPLKRGRHIVVVGAGNVAMDTARTAVRLGAETVTVVYRRTREDMPARLEEVEHAEKEGVRFVTLANPIEILGTTQVEGVKCVRMRQTEPDESGRRKVEPVPDSEFVIECDQVIMSLGTSPNPLIKNSLAELRTSKNGTIVVDENLETSIKNVYAGGDTVTGAATVILAMGAGKKAAQSMLRKVREKIIAQ
ncbi:MAG TPA: NADPH-dependent glutamate synthase [Clostridia bacterium]|nr:NADPH-dependent glutamate synthase [Clostridia bacterium]